MAYMKKTIRALKAENTALKLENQKWRRLVNKYHLGILETDEDNGIDLDTLLTAEESE